MSSARESANVSRILSEFAGARTVPEKVVLIDELFTYLASTEEILKNDRFRNMIHVKMLEFMNDPLLPPDTFRDSIRLLCDKLSLYESGPIEACVAVAPPAPVAFAGNGTGTAAAVAAATAPVTTTPDYKILGAGGFGAVFTPALPNIVAGVSTNYPGNVTKMFYGEDEMNEAMNAVERLPAIMGVNKGHRAHRYSRKYKGSNLPPSLFSLLKDKNPELRRSTDLYLIRMPNLGVDIDHIDGVYKEVRKRPFEHIVKQIQKVIHQTATIASNKYAHFDIRPSNVMITPSTGDITIVDFDWLKPYDVLYKDYPLGFWSNPPESLFIKSMPLTDPVPSDDIIRQFLVLSKRGPQMNAYENYNLHSLRIGLERKNINNKAVLHNKLIEANMKNVKYLKSKGYTHMKLLVKEQFFPFVDNYGLGFTLLELIAHVYPYGIDGSTGEVIIDKSALATRITKEGVPYTDAELDTIITALKATILLLDRMSSFVMEERPTPAEAAAEIDRIVSPAFAAPPVAASAAPAVPNASNNNARRELMRMAYLAGNTNVLRNSRRKERKSRKSRRSTRI